MTESVDHSPLSKVCSSFSHLPNNSKNKIKPPVYRATVNRTEALMRANRQT